MPRPSTEAIAYSAAALKSGNVREALAIRNREFGHVGSFDDSSLRVIESILTRMPALLADCPPEIVQPLRVAAALMELWGENSIRHFVTIEGEWGYRFSPDAVALNLHSHGCFLCRLEDYRSLAISHVELLAANDSNDCPACRAVHKKRFTIDEVPELPLADCSCQRYGCRVVLVVAGDGP